MEAPRSRRDEYSEATRQALLDSAARLFADKGFAATSLDEVAADARVTKGAVYHHFTNKQALFEAVADQAEVDACAAIMAAAAEAGDPWSGAIAGLDAFLERCLDPVYQRLCFQEGPAVLGFAAWWEHGEKHEIGLIRAMLAGLHAQGLVDSDDLDTLTQLLFGSMAAIALALARADDPKAASLSARQAIIRLVAGLRPAGVPLPPIDAPPAGVGPAGGA
ncbi:MAG TPA: TetR/AcrR family transcriptional regulator [Acidimicrobiales bacterium]|nr:TetR/AcrR family transcriptional regulator [Acidimicrobiales bacterium]